MIDPVSDAAQSEERELIELSFPAYPDLVVLARFAAATMAARAGFDVEEIEDLRLAVDELFVSFGPRFADGCVRLELHRSEDTINIVGSFEPSSHAEANDGDKDENWQRATELSELLLDSLVDEHGRGINHSRPSAWLRKRRSPTQ